MTQTNNLLRFFLIFQIFEKYAIFADKDDQI